MLDTLVRELPDGNDQGVPRRPRAGEVAQFEAISKRSTPRSAWAICSRWRSDVRRRCDVEALVRSGGAFHSLAAIGERTPVVTKAFGQKADAATVAEVTPSFMTGSRASGPRRAAGRRIHEDVRRKSGRPPRIPASGRRFRGRQRVRSRPMAATACEKIATTPYKLHNMQRRRHV